MQNFSLESEEASIVFVGSFEPAIFHPEWLVRHGLITEDDIKESNVEIVHHDLAKFSLQWLAIDVLRNKFVARTHDPSKFAPLKDLMFSVFKILSHTPIKQLGMNLAIRYKVETEELWHKIGDTLVPKTVWEESLPKRVGMISLDVQSPRRDSLNGFIRVNVSPIRREFFGVSFNINSHVELKHPEDKEPSTDVTDVLALHWDASLTTAREICDKTLRKAIEA